jgi:hypothetical protein
METLKRVGYILRVTQLIMKKRVKQGWNTISRYITIETGVKPKPNCVYTSGKPMRHQMIHTLLLCVENCWHELEYVKNRREQASLDMYKSQEGRLKDY